jgi:hypothetical protein
VSHPWNTPSPRSGFRSPAIALHLRDRVLSEDFDAAGYIGVRE